MARPNDLRKQVSLQQLNQLFAVVIEDGAVPVKLTTDILRSQAQTYGLSIEELHIHGTSLNTAKRIANRIFANGFAGLDSRRQQALNALLSAQEKANARPSTRRERLQERIQELEAETEILKEDLLHLTEAFDFALSCMRKYFAYVTDASTRAAYEEDESELFARAGLARAVPAPARPSLKLVQGETKDA